MKIFIDTLITCEDIYILPVLFTFFLICLFIVALILILYSIKLKNKLRYISHFLATSCICLVLIGWLRYEYITYGWTGCPSDLFSSPYSYFVRIGIDDDQIVHIYKPDKLLTFPFFLELLRGNIDSLDIFRDYYDKERKREREGVRLEIESYRQRYEDKGYIVKIENWRPELEVFFVPYMDEDHIIPYKERPIIPPPPKY
jgi:hypothetical protein